MAQAIGTPIVINKNSISIDAFEVAGVPKCFRWGQILKSTSDKDHKNDDMIDDRNFVKA